MSNEKKSAPISARVRKSTKDLFRQLLKVEYRSGSDELELMIHDRARKVGLIPPDDGDRVQDLVDKANAGKIPESFRDRPVELDERADDEDGEDHEDSDGHEKRGHSPK